LRRPTYAIVIDYYARLTKQQLKELETGNLPSTSFESAQLQLLRTSSGESAIVLDKIADNLTQLITAVERQKLQGAEALAEVELIKM
jgi:two-component system, NtrC family, sensor kinase